MNDTELIKNLRKRLEWTMSVLNHGVIPEPAHQGTCGPEAGCDCLCMDTAHFCSDEWSEDVLPLAKQAGLCSQVNYDPEVHGWGIEAEPGDEIWFWGKGE